MSTRLTRITSIGFGLLALLSLILATPASAQQKTNVVFKSKVASIGPEVGYAFTIGGLPAYFNLRGYWEFRAENRLQGYAAFATLVIPLGPRKATGQSL